MLMKKRLILELSQSFYLQINNKYQKIVIFMFLKDSLQILIIFLSVIKNPIIMGFFITLLPFFQKDVSDCFDTL